VYTIAYAFPNVKIVTSAVDPEINEKFHVLPGMGNFGDRWALQLKIQKESKNKTHCKPIIFESITVTKIIKINYLEKFIYESKKNCL
jgi:hypothetical protein